MGSRLETRHRAPTARVSADCKGRFRRGEHKRKREMKGRSTGSEEPRRARSVATWSTSVVLHGKAGQARRIAWMGHQPPTRWTSAPRDTKVGGFSEARTLFGHLYRRGTTRGRYDSTNLCAGRLGRRERCCLMGCAVPLSWPSGSE